MKIELNQKEYKLFFKDSWEDCSYIIGKTFRRNGEKFISTEYIKGKERVVECFVTDVNNKIFAKGNSRCYYKDRFVKEKGRTKAIKNLCFGSLAGWDDIAAILRENVLNQYNNRKNEKFN